MKEKNKNNNNNVKKNNMLLDHHIQRSIAKEMEEFDEKALALVIKTLLEEHKDSNTIH